MDGQISVQLAFNETAWTDNPPGPEDESMGNPLGQVQNIGCDATYPIPTTRVSTSTTDPNFMPFTPPISVADGSAVSAFIETTEVGTDAELYLAARYFEIRPDDPDASTTLGSAITTVTTTPRLVSLSASAKWGVQLGVAWRKSTGSTEAIIEFAGSLSIHQCAKVIGIRPFTLPPVLSAVASVPTFSESWVVELSDLMPTAGVTKMKLIVWGRNLQNYGDVRTQAIYRTADSPAIVGSWTGAEGGFDTPSSADDERNTGELSLTLTNKAMFQPAVAICRANGGSAISGNFFLACMIIK